MQPRIAIVVSHHQRMPGILAQTLRSVFGQRNAPPFCIILIDDESPVPAEAELAQLGHCGRTQITVIHRTNGGTSKARNTGLDAVPKTADYVALLDGDDIWHEDHLARAAGAMDLGYDFFFSDHRRKGYERSWFGYAGFNPDLHTPIEIVERLYAFRGSFFDTILRKSPVGTSTVLMRRSCLGSLRFNNNVGTCDDLLFWLLVAGNTDRIAFSACEQVLLGEGINQSIVPDWRTNKALRYILSEGCYFRKVQQTFDLTPIQQNLVQAALQRARSSFARTFLAMLAAGRMVEPRLISRALRSDPALVAALPEVMANEILHRLRASRGSRTNA